MSSTYTGDGSNVTPANPVEISEPADGDALNASSVNAAFDTLTDYAAFLKRATYDGDFTVVKVYADGTGNAANANAAGTIVASDSITAETGSITATLGGVVAGGNVEAGGTVEAGTSVLALDGYVQASGDPASDAGRLRGKQLVSSNFGVAAPAGGAAGAALTTPGAGGGAGTVTVGIGSTDVAGGVQFLVGPAGGAAPGAGVMGTVVLGKAYPSAPVVTLTPVDANAAGITWYVSSQTANGGPGGQATFAVSTGSINLPATSTYTFNYHVIGVE